VALPWDPLTLRAYSQTENDSRYCLSHLCREGRWGGEAAGGRVAPKNGAASQPPTGRWRREL